MTSPLTVPETAARMAQIIRARGWHQGWFCSGRAPNAPVCLAGAYNVAHGREPDKGDRGAADTWFAFQAAANRHLRRSDPRRTSTDSMSDWNDVRSRTVDDVLSLLDAIAAEVTT